MSSPSSGSGAGARRLGTTSHMYRLDVDELKVECSDTIKRWLSRQQHDRKRILRERRHEHRMRVRAKRQLQHLQLQRHVQLVV